MKKWEDRIRMRPSEFKGKWSKRQWGQACALLFVFVALIAWAPCSSLAQGLFGTITGSVFDATGAMIPGATVTITNTATNVTASVKTNGEGEFTVTSLNPGSYRVVGVAQGFKRAVANEVILQVDARQKVNLRLQPGGSTETIVVTATSPLLQTEQSSVSQNITDREISELPVISGSGNGSAGRSIFNLIGLSGSVSQQKGEGGDGYDNTRINGGRPRMDDYLLDGTSTEHVTFGGSVATPSVDSVAEMNIISNSFSAEFGKVSGGVITVTTKSGTNQYHGSVYEYLQNDKLNSENYFQPVGVPKYPLRLNEFGGTVGGFVIKSKLFFFTDYEGLKATATNPLHNQLVPDPAAINGDLSGLLAGSKPTQLYDPSGNAYPNNQIPVSPISKALLALWPAMNGGESGTVGVGWYDGTTTNATTVNRVNPRVDWHPGSNDHLFGVVHYQHEKYGNESSLPDSYSYTTNPDISITAGWTHLFNIDKLNDFHYGYTHRWPIRTPRGYGTVDDSSFGLTGIPVCNLTASNGKCGAPELNVGSWAGVGSGGMLIEPAGQYELLDALTIMHKTHTIKIGAEVRRASLNNIQPQAPEGKFAFDAKAGTKNAIANFLIGYMDTSSINEQSEYTLSRTWADALFIQDDYRVTSKFTLNLGMRWQYDPSWHEQNRQLASFDPYNLTWTQMGLNGAPQGSVDTHWAEFAPRLGFAYNLVPKTVFRAGFGITYPGVYGHGAQGDGNASPNVSTVTTFGPGTYLSHLPAVNVPNPTGALAAWQGSWFYYTPRTQGTNYFEQWNVVLEQQLTKNIALTLSYHGSHGVHLPVNSSYNLCQDSQVDLAQNGYNAQSMDSPYCAPGNYNALGGYSYADLVFPGWWGLSSSVYHAGEAKVEKRFADGLSFLSTVTWSKLMDDSSSDWAAIGGSDMYGQDFYHRSAERSVSAGDIPLRWVLSGIYEIPVGHGHRHLSHGMLGQTIGGWRTTGIYSLSSGDAVGMTDGGWLNEPTNTFATRPNIVSNPMPKGFKRTTGEWFNTSAFDWSGTWNGDFYSNLYAPNLLDGWYPNPAYAFGNSGRFNSHVRAGGVNNLDFSLQKEISIPKLGEWSGLELQADGFNALNHPQFQPPDSYGSPLFGVVSGTRNNGRIVQVGAHLHF